jgi:hypothetical protein
METPISPKVIVSVIVGIVLTAIASNVSAITPDMFNFLGPWKLFVFGSMITALMGLAAWWKTDPLRVTPETAPAKVSGFNQPTTFSLDVPAPAKTFPAAKVEAAQAVPEPVAIEPVYTPPAAQTIA